MPVLELKNLRKSYRTPDGARLPVVDVPEFALDAGQQVALRGPSGSGKTTLLHLIAGILAPDEGSIVLDDRDLAALSEAGRDRARADAIGYVFQTFNLLPGYTAFENVLLGMLFGDGADPARAEQLLVRVGLGDRLHYRPGQLSVGQQQRVALARALAGKPKLVLADEPTGNLDRVRALEAMTLIRDTCREQNAALLLVSHDAAILDSFDDQHDLAELNRAAAPEASA